MMQKATEQQQRLSHDDIAKVAWSIWEQEGCPPGRDQEHWLKAEQQLLAAKSEQSAKPLISTTKLKTLAGPVRRSVTRGAVL
jgi:hypothetical protein